MESLPIELIECILDNLNSDKNALYRCSLVEKAWVVPSQRHIFEKIDLDGCSPASRSFLKTKTERLIAIFDEKPHLASSVRFLGLHLQLYATILPENLAEAAKVIQRLSGVDAIQLTYFRWETLSPLLRMALIDVLKAPSLTRITLFEFTIPTFVELASLLGQATHLKALSVKRGDFNRIRIPITSDMVINPPRSIKLDELETDDIDAFISWFQDESCPFEVQNLRYLRLNAYSTRDYQLVAFMVQHSSCSITKLELQYCYGLQNFDLIHLGHTPNLHTLTLNCQECFVGTDSIVRWIEFLFRPRDRNGNSGNAHPLRHFTLLLSTRSWDAAQWEAQCEQFAILDARLQNAMFSSLDMVNIVVKASKTQIMSSTEKLYLASQSIPHPSTVTDQSGLEIFYRSTSNFLLQLHNFVAEARRNLEKCDLEDTRPVPLAKTLDFHWGSLLSPIRRLPPEIMSKILELAIAG
ncbi:hypothetical protein BT96DRAFT_1006148 [Gymnopus androsaceus JB14]|uniref:F-box domain-containing protein n=1 Tax=Gymnopus androsaceus JB14 TaxID=1447944 RepID=A0A6A4GM60_9AGAR|nr:hypothetical protein BT96DRAFT_1006148 [Gymnopus androsaceus JB14]